MKKKLIHGSMLAFAVAVGAVIVITPIAMAGPRVCPQIYAPVICDNGRIYPNQCVADRNHARNCVPYGQL